MQGDLMSPCLSETSPVFKSFVDCFLSILNKLLHVKIISWIGKSGGTLHVLWMFTMIDVNSLHSLILGKVRQEAISEDLEIIVGSRDRAH